MKRYSIFVITFSLILGLLPSRVRSQTDSCSSNLNLNGQLLFETSSFNCNPVWDSQGYILRYKQTASDLWSFILSAPNPDAYVAIGFSPDGNMVGSSAMVGWVTDSGTTVIKQYYLGGQSPAAVEPDKGNLNVVGNTSAVIYQGSRIYLAFQLSTAQPLNRIIYSVGQVGRLPSTSTYLLYQHVDMISTTLNYATGSQTQTKTIYGNLRRTHGILNMMGWGILMPLGAIAARYFKRWDPLWFYSHVFIQSLGFILGVAGVICGFVLQNKLSAIVTKHKAIGIFVLVLGCLQVMAVLARPDKGSKYRMYWNWYHYTVGRLLLMFAAINVFYGIHIGNAGGEWNAAYGVILGVLFIATIVLELRMWMRK